MKNVSIRTEGTKIIIELDAAKEHGRSSTGKTIIVASTEGNTKQNVPGVGEVMIGLNVYKYPSKGG